MQTMQTKYILSTTWRVVYKNTNAELQATEEEHHHSLQSNAFKNNTYANHFLSSKIHALSK